MKDLKPVVGALLNGRAASGMFDLFPTLCPSVCLAFHELFDMSLVLWYNNFFGFSFETKCVNQLRRLAGHVSVVQLLQLRPDPIAWGGYFLFL